MSLLALLFSAFIGSAAAQSNPVGPCMQDHACNITGGTQTGVTYAPLISTTISAAGSSQGTATAISSQNNIITSCSGSQGVVLTNTTSVPVLIANRSGNMCSVYPPSGAQIESAGSNVAVGLSDSWQQTFMCVSATQCRVF